MRTVSSLALGMLFLVAAGCGSPNLKDAIVGKWDVVGAEEKASATKAEFTKNGDFSMPISSFTTVTGKYKFLQDDVFETEYELMSQKGTQKYKVELKGDDMTLTEQEGAKATVKYKRAK
jgi:hypothetical protein